MLSEPCTHSGVLATDEVDDALLRVCPDYIRCFDVPLGCRLRLDRRRTQRSESPGSAGDSVVGAGGSTAGGGNTSSAGGGTVNAGGSSEAGGATDKGGAAGSPSGSGSTGGTAGNGGASAADAGPVPHVVGKCDKLGAVGTWEEITPPLVSLDRNFMTPAGTNYGVGTFVIDPQNTSTVYVGTSSQGIYKTTDCGATWIHVNTGKNAKMLDDGRQWTMQIDPVDPNIIFTVAGYGPDGVWKSTNGGVDWDQAFPRTSCRSSYSVDSRQGSRWTPKTTSICWPRHDFTCQNGHSSSCMLETKDGGTTWSVIENAPDSGEGSGLPMVDSKTWLWMTGSGMWRTGNAGQSWAKVHDGGVSDGFYHAKDGSLYVGSDPKLLRSTDDGVTWTPISTASASTSIAGDGTTIFSSRSFCTGKSDKGYQPYSSALESSPRSGRPCRVHPCSKAGARSPTTPITTFCTRTIATKAFGASSPSRDGVGFDAMRN